MKKENPLWYWIILLNIIVPTVLAVYSAVATMVMQTSIVGGIPIDGKYTQWITIFYLLGVNTTVPLANRVCDRVGYKKMYFIGIFLFTIGSLGSALAFNFLSLGLSRLIEGIGAGLIFPVGMAIIVRNFPKEKLPLALNLYLGMSFGVGFSIGSIIPGYFAMNLLWQYAFYLLIPFGIISMIICALFFIESEKVHRGRFDYFGFIAFASGIAFLLIALTEGNLKSTDEGWRSTFIIGCFIASFVSFILFLLIEKKVDNPIIPLKTFQDPGFTVGCLTLFSLGIVIFSSVTLMFAYMQGGLLYDKFTSGMNMLSYGVFLGIFSVLSNALMKCISPIILSIVALAIVIFSLFLNNILTIQSGKVAIFSILAIKGAGVGLALGPVTAQSLKHLPQRLATDGATLTTFFRQVGGTYGSSILGILVIRRRIFHNQMFMEPINTQLSGYQYSFMKLKKSYHQCSWIHSYRSR